MTDTLVREAQIGQYELEIGIESTAERVWVALLNETNAWWLSDFRMVDPESTVKFDAFAGGGLIEHKAEGGSLLWYTVQFFDPASFSIHLVGQVAPDWGGPTTSHLKIQIESAGEQGCLFKVSDAHFGRIDEGTLNSLESGWRQLFADGLKKYVEGETKI